MTEIKEFTPKRPVITAVKCPVIDKTLVAEIRDFVRTASLGYTTQFNTTNHGSLEFVHKNGVVVKVFPLQWVVTGVTHGTPGCPNVGDVLKRNLLAGLEVLEDE